jgi:hypothetical protein
VPSDLSTDQIVRFKMWLKKQANTPLLEHLYKEGEKDLNA